MENRERDRVSRRSTPTDAGRVNRETEERKGQDERSDAEFGRSIGRAENLNEPSGNPRGNRED